MNNITNEILTTSMKESQNQYPLPSSIRTATDVLQKVHAIFTQFELARIIKRDKENPNEGDSLVLGSAINLFAPLTNTTNYALQIALIGKCASDIVNQYHKVYVAYESLQDSVQNRFPVFEPESLDLNEEFSILSPSFKKKFDENIANMPAEFLENTEKVAILFWEVFKMSMCLESVRLFAKNDPAQRNMACVSLVNDLKQYHKKLEDNSFLIKEINNNNKTIDKIINRLNENNATKPLFTVLSSAFTQITDSPLFKELQATASETISELIFNASAPILIPTIKQGSVLDKNFSSERYPPYAGQKIEIPKKKALSNMEIGMSMLSNIAKKTPEKAKAVSEKIFADEDFIQYGYGFQGLSVKLAKACYTKLTNATSIV